MGITVEEFDARTRRDGFDVNLDAQFVELPSDLGGGRDLGVLPKEAADAIGLDVLPFRICHGEHRGSTNGTGFDTSSSDIKRNWHR
jgi:hypothetical protein